MGIGEWEETRGRGVCMCFWDGNDGDSDAFVCLFAMHLCTTHSFFFLFFATQIKLLQH